jgi:hypothetical protein
MGRVITAVLSVVGGIRARWQAGLRRIQSLHAKALAEAEELERLAGRP